MHANSDLRSKVTVELALWYRGHKVRWFVGPVHLDAANSTGERFVSLLLVNR
jgi:hypothetical protein